MYHSVFNHSATEGYFGCFQLWATLKKFLLIYLLIFIFIKLIYFSLRRPPDLMVSFGTETKSGELYLFSRIDHFIQYKMRMTLIENICSISLRERKEQCISQFSCQLLVHIGIGHLGYYPKQAWIILGWIWRMYKWLKPQNINHTDICSTILITA